MCKEKMNLICLDYPKCHESIGYNILQTSEDDEKDREFLKIIDNNIFRDESKQWVAPLPFRFVCLLVCLFGVYRPTQEFFTHMETSPLPAKGCKF